MTPTDSQGNGRVLDRAEFGAYIEQQLYTIDAIELLNRTDLDLMVRIYGADLRINLEQFYSAYLQNPPQLDMVVATLLKTLHGFTPNRSICAFVDLHNRVYPMLKPITLLVNVREHNLPMLVYRPFLADLIITYVIDETESVTYVNETHLENWQIDEQTLHEQALENLRQRTVGNTSYTTAGEGQQRLFIFNNQDGYDATRLLLPELLEQWKEQLPGKMVIGIPNRDFLIAFSDIDRAILMNIAHQIQADATQHDYGLSDQLFTLVGGEIRTYSWE